VEKSPDAMEHKLRFETAGVDLVNDTHRANQALENVLSTLARVPAKLFAESASLALRHDQIVTRVAQKFRIDQARVRTRLNELRMTYRSTPVSIQEQAVPKKTELSRCDRKEKELVQIIIHEPALLDYAAENVSPDEFSIGPLREIYEVMNDCFLSGKAAGYQQLMLELEDPDLKAIVDELQDEAIEKKQVLQDSEGLGEFQPQRQLETVIQAFQQLVCQTGTRQTISQLQEKQLDEQDELTALEELLNQTRQRQGLKRPTDG
jgi:DNA primase